MPTRKISPQPLPAPPPPPSQPQPPSPESPAAEPSYRKVYDPASARRYAQHIDERGPKHAAEARLLLRAFARVPRRDRVLDVPCGGGRMTVLLARAGWRVEGADVSPGMLDVASERLGAEHLEIPLHHADLEQTGFADGAFDTILCFRLFHHLPTEALRERILGELCRIARHRVVLSYLDARTWSALRRKVVGRLRGKVYAKFECTPRRLAQRFEARGFRCVADLGRAPVLHTLRIGVFERRDAGPGGSDPPGAREHEGDPR